MDFNTFIQDEYEALLDIATALYIKTNLDPVEVLSEMYISVRDRQINPTAKDYRYYCIRWLSNARYWKGGNPIKKLYICDHKASPQELHKYETYEELKGTEIVKDLQRQGFTQEQSEALELYILKAKRLPLYKKRLFELYYLEGYSHGEIAKSCNLPRTAIYRDVQRVIKDLKT